MNPVSKWLDEISHYICFKAYCPACKYIGKEHWHGPQGQRKYQGTVLINNTAASTVNWSTTASTATTVDLNVTNMF